MKKSSIIEALEEFDDDDNLVFEGNYHPITYMPKVLKVCGGTQKHMCYYCILDAGHEGDCFCACKQVNFTRE